MSKSRIDLSQSKLSNMSEIQLFVDQLKKENSYQKAPNNELIHQNKRILQILKSIQHKIDKELQIHKKNMLMTNPHHKVIFNKDQMRLLQQKEANNVKLISVLQKDFGHILSRKKMYQEGLQEKTTHRKHQLQDKVTNLKIQIKKLHQTQKQSQKKLQAYQNLSQADYFKEYARIEQQLRIFSSKYVKLVSRYNKVTEQLAIAAQVDTEFQIPEQIYNKQLQEKQQAQYKQYKSIVKLCTILSKRNDSENNKANRIYTQKLKQLERTILHLTQLERSISFKQTQILQGKKNVDMIKLKISNNQKVEKQLFRISQGSRNSFGQELRQKSYSSVKLLKSQQNSNNKLRNRGLSFGRLPIKIKE